MRIPDWAKTLVGVCVVGIPVVFFLFTAHTRASDADERSSSNEERITVLEQQRSAADARDAARWEEIQRTLRRIDATLEALRERDK